MAYDFSKGSKTIRKVGFLDGVNGSKIRPTSPFSLESSKGLVAKYFDSTKDSLSSTRLLDQSPLNSGTRRTGEEGRCYLYDGVDDYSTLDSVITLSGDLSLSFWAKRTDITKYHIIFNDGALLTPKVGFDILTDNLFIRFSGASVWLANSGVDTTTWNHYVITRTAGVAKAYVNGIDLGTTSTASGSGDFVFSSISTFTGQLYKGNLFDIRIYNKALSQEEVDFVYSFGKTGTNPSLPVNWWKCDEQSGVIGYDSVGGNNLTHTNITAATFHSTQDIWSFQNQVGFNEASNYFSRSEPSVLTGLANLGVTAESATGGLISYVSNQVSYIDNAATRYAYSSSTVLTGSEYLNYTFEAYVEMNDGSEPVAGDSLNSLADFNIVFGSAQIQSGILVENVAGNVYKLSITPTSLSNFKGGAVVGNNVGIAKYTSQSSKGFKASRFWLKKNAEPDNVYIRTTGNSITDQFIPRDESDPTNDVLGNPLTNTGRRPNDAALHSSNCLTLNGTNQAVRVADNTALDITDNLTVCVWAKNNNSIPTTETIIAKYDYGSNDREFALVLLSSSKVRFAISSSGTSFDILETAPLSNVDVWNHYAFTFAGGVVKIYINGVSVSYTGTTSTTSIYSSLADLIIGGQLNSGAVVTQWDGQIFDARIYAGDSTVLTAAQIQDIYEDGSNNIQFAGQSLRAHYKLAEGGGTQCLDASGNENHGTIENAATNWSVTQDVYHSNLLNGFSLYEHASSDPIRVPFDITGSPILITPPTGYSKTSDNPSGDYNNNAETLIDLDPDSTPEMNNIYLESVFNGSTSNGYVTNDSVLNFTDNLTVSCWAKSDLTDITSSADTLVSMYESTGNLQVWRMEISTDEKLRFQVGNSGGTGATIETADSAYPIDTWTHYAATFDGGVVKLYVNGELQSSSESSAHATSLNGRSAPLVLGAFYWSGGGGSFQEWDGSLRNIRVYKGDSSPLSNSQIVRDMIETRSQPRFEGQTVIASYDLIKDTLDRSGNGLNAQNNNISFTKKTVPASLDLGDDLGEDGIVQKTVKFDSGEWGAVFDGSSYAIVKNREKLKIKEKPFSIECSVKTSDTGSNTILSKYQTSGNLRSYSLNIESGKIVFHSSSNGTAVVSSTGSDTINDGSWHKIKVVRESESGTSLKMYVDDVEDTGVGGSLASNFSENISNVAIGAYNTDATAANVFTGNIRELKVFTDDNIERASWELAKDTRDSSSNNYHGENNGITFLTPKQEYGYTVSDSTPLAKQDQYLKEYHKSRLFL